jgi:hypothetical protein
VHCITSAADCTLWKCIVSEVQAIPYHCSAKRSSALDRKFYWQIIVFWYWYWYTHTHDVHWVGCTVNTQPSFVARVYVNVSKMLIALALVRRCRMYQMQMHSLQ